MTYEVSALGAAAKTLALYMLVAASPGPNTFAVGAQAALRGLGAALPLCAGLALGVALAALGGCAGASALAWDERLQLAARAVAAGALVMLALRMAETPRASATRAVPARLPAGVGCFGLGLLTAISNPVTWAYFATACLGPAGQDWELLVAGAGAVALSIAVLVAALLSRPDPRAWAERHQRPLRLGGAGLLGAYAGWAIAPALVG